MIVPKLLPTTNFERFFSALQPGSIFTYSDTFLHRDVVELAKKYGLAVKYFAPKTPEYIEHGCFTCSISGYIDLQERRNKILRQQIHEAYVFLRTHNSTIPDDVLDFIRDAALEKVDMSVE